MTRSSEHFPHPVPSASEGLRRDLPTLQRQLLQRRAALRWIGASACSAALPLSLLACGGTEEDDVDAACAAVPAETAGPYPADGTSASGQRLNALTLSGIVRSDIRRSVGSASGTAAGVPLRVVLTLVNSSTCVPLAGLAVYLWHCTRDGSYSMYSGGHTNQNYLRGVQVSDASGIVQFSTIFPGCYSGRWPHIHFEVYGSLDAALGDGAVGDHVLVSQLALPSASCVEVYEAATGYTASADIFAATSLARDNVFGEDLARLQMADVQGSVATGYTASLQVGLEI